MVTVQFERLENGHGLDLPRQATEGAAGMDIRSAEAFTLWAGETRIVPTGFAVACPVGYEVQVRSRSGLAANSSVFVLNGPATIDSDYRGELGVILHNASKTGGLIIHRGDRIAQLVVAEVPRVTVEEVESLPPTDRGVGGFGSTGRA